MWFREVSYLDLGVREACYHGKTQGYKHSALGRHCCFLASKFEVSVGKPCIISVGSVDLISSAEISFLPAGRAARSQGEGVLPLPTSLSFSVFLSCLHGNIMVCRTDLSSCSGYPKKGGAQHWLRFAKVEHHLCAPIECITSAKRIPGILLSEPLKCVVYTTSLTSM